MKLKQCEYFEVETSCRALKIVNIESARKSDNLLNHTANYRAVYPKKRNQAYKSTEIHQSRYIKFRIFTKPLCFVLTANTIHSSGSIYKNKYQCPT